MGRWAMMAKGKAKTEGEERLRRGEARRGRACLVCASAGLRLRLRLVWSGVTFDRTVDSGQCEATLANGSVVLVGLFFNRASRRRESRSVCDYAITNNYLRSLREFVQ